MEVPYRVFSLSLPCSQSLEEVAGEGAARGTKEKARTAVAATPQQPPPLIEQGMTHSDDVILPEPQLVVVVSLKVQQSLSPSPSGARNYKKVLMVSLVALHGVVRSQLLERWEKFGYKNEPLNIHTVPVLQCENSQRWSAEGPDSESALQCGASASSSPNSRELRVDFLRRDCLLTA
ncbi:hypothetical protein F7725_003583 [Dissostichus mawsoni]|uniref:Uncharacterized protein n=1 Tax=Dissostichus mawsoni TaxID=36200 RepID=A0A7J5YAS2_DISMA|nr:hypothetical protein F7725_003583 [Dissostichus mawsoni]